MKNKFTLLISLVAISLILKLLLYIFVCAYAPKAKFMPDTLSYLRPGQVLVTKGIFAQPDASGALKLEAVRTPGYPLFTGLLHTVMKLSLDHMVLVQVILTIIAALVTYLAAVKIDTRLGILSVIMLLFDPPVAILSMLLLSETLFLVLSSVFLFFFVAYLKNKGIKDLVLSALFLVSATYVRPISYYLGFLVAIFIIAANVNKSFKKNTVHLLIFLGIVYTLLGVWQVRNYIHFQHASFSGIIQTNLNDQGLVHSFSRNKDPYSKDLPPFLYYINTTTRCLMSLMTRPGSFKYFRFPFLTIFGKILGYPWIIFVMTGLVAGIAAMKKNIYYRFMLLVIVYFIITSIGGVMWNVSERFRATMMPFIAILSAYGWVFLFDKIKSKRVFS